MVFEIFLPHAILLAGEKVLIGDNLASHFSEEVLRACEEHNIKFISLLPNAMHLLQPLDVAVFGPLKRVWKGILAEWRKETRHRGTAPKEIFPLLLARLCNGLKKENMVAGFRATGLFPIDMGEVLKRFPSEESDQNVSELFGDSAAQLLKEHISEKNALPTCKRDPKVAPGKAVSVADLTKTSSASSSSKTPTVTPATDSDERDSSDDSTLLESEEEDVCQICFGENPPGDVESI